MRSVEWTHPALKYFRRLPPKIREQIQKRIHSLREDPFSTSIELRDWKGLRRIKAGDWRVIFRVTDQSVRIIAIGPRGDIYK